MFHPEDRDSMFLQNVDNFYSHNENEADGWQKELG
jgi:hypothetical protein